MASSTKNVKIGVCRVTLGGLDLGYTKGGVEVTVKTDTHEVNIDQFGKAAVNEYIMGRSVTAKVPLAETTMPILAATMPGAVYTPGAGGVQASGTITVTTNPTAGQTVVFNVLRTAGGTPVPVTVTFKVGAKLLNNEVEWGSSAAITAANLAAFLQSNWQYGNLITGTVAAAVVTVKAVNQGVDGNALGVALGTATGLTLSGLSGGATGTLTGGVEPSLGTLASSSGIGTDLLSIAKELRFHPQSKADTDLSDDFVMPYAATAGGLTFAYKLEDERVFSVEFQGYPDPVGGTNGQLFRIGV